MGIRSKSYPSVYLSTTQRNAPRPLPAHLADLHGRETRVHDEFPGLPSTRSIHRLGPNILYGLPFGSKRFLSVN
ncbi:hypothetical protein PT974_11378 [Cladobotryum mycophilum]|uniref:Uncharacterized protein n=1 Tax=Cladobotryum mycophilum TaxID=491253 RepID=A0ABR0S525_9HYPO